MKSWILLVLTALATNTASTLISDIQVPGNTSCACSGEVLTFVCTTVGPGQTIWRGTAFNCTGESNEIILRHSEFASPTGTSGTCNSGAIVGQSLGVENANCYVSQLNITIKTQFNNKTVECVYNSDTESIIGQSRLRVVSASNPYLPPNDVSLIGISNGQDFEQGQVTFNWTSVSSSCPLIDYVITSDCGVCPSSTNSTTVTCSDLQLPTQSDNSVCSFNVSSRVCGIVGNHTTAILTAAVPDVPRVLSIVPLYTNESQSLKRLTLTIDMNKTRIDPNDISGPIAEFVITYSTQSTLVDKTINPAEPLSCENDLCYFTVPVPSVCFSSTKINVTVSAKNRIGQGPSSDKIIIDCINMFVRVYFNSLTSIFSCEFLNQVDDSVKSCEITVDQRLRNRGQTTPGNPNIVLLDLSDLEGGTYYYIVTANSNVTAIEIERTYTMKGAQENVNTMNLALIIGIILPVVAVYFF